MAYRERNRIAYDKTAEEFKAKQEARATAARRVVQSFSTYFEGGDKLLDVGPGNGQMARYLSEDYDVTMIEFSEEMAAVAKQTAPDARLIVDDFLAYDFDQVFDGVLASAFIHLFPEQDRRRVMKKVRDVLREDGYAYVSTTKHDKGSEGFEDKENFEASVQRYRKRFTEDEVRGLISESGFRVVDYEERVDDEADRTWMNVVLSPREPGVTVEERQGTGEDT